ncbi:50S ribosomal protein L41 [Rhodococcus opacus PD630]|nr:50S ribosomal protein L41 [Rhodococcus opacus PD630]
MIHPADPGGRTVASAVNPLGRRSRAHRRQRFRRSTTARSQR